MVEKSWPSSERMNFGRTEIFACLSVIYSRVTNLNPVLHGLAATTICGLKITFLHQIFIVHEGIATTHDTASAGGCQVRYAGWRTDVRSKSYQSGLKSL